MPHTDGMTEKTRQLIKKIIYLAGITVAVYLGMRFALPIVIPFLLAILIARILCKPVAFLSEKTRLPKGIVSTAAVLLLLAVIFLPVGYLVYKGICELASLITNYPALFGKADTLWCSCCERVAEITGMKTETMVQWGKKLRGICQQSGRNEADSGNDEWLAGIFAGTGSILWHLHCNCCGGSTDTL